MNTELGCCGMIIYGRAQTPIIAHQPSDATILIFCNQTPREEHFTAAEIRVGVRWTVLNDTAHSQHCELRMCKSGEIGIISGRSLPLWTLKPYGRPGKYIHRMGDFLTENETSNSTGRS